jgi:hypothetical protein
MVSTADIATAAARELLRQLSIGLSVYRLFPGELEHTGFVAAVERIREAAQRALRNGTVHAEIRGGHEIVLEDGTTLSDEQAGRLALACYERGVEHLHVVGVPDAQDLAAVYEALSQPEAEISVYGGLDPALAARGVTTLRFGEVAPEPVDEVARSLERLSPEVRELWEQMEDPQLLAASLLAGESSTSPTVAARTVYARFNAIADALPDHLTSRPRFAGISSLIRSIRALNSSMRSRDSISVCFVSSTRVASFSAAVSCSTCPAPRCQTPRRRPLHASCPRSITRCSPTPTGPASSHHCSSSPSCSSSGNRRFESSTSHPGSSHRRARSRIGSSGSTTYSMPVGRV